MSHDPGSSQRPARISRRSVIEGAGGVGGAAMLGRVGYRGADAQETTPVAAFSASERAGLEAILAAHIERTGAPGAAAGVWIPGRGEWLQAKGVSNIETNAPLQVSDKIRIASITKTFVGTALLQLVDEGLLGLDDVLENYVPDVPHGDTATIRQVIGMTSGIFSYTEDEEFLAAYLQDPMMVFSPGEAIDIARRHEPYFPPGAGFHYSDTNYILLGLILEQLTGVTAEEAITQRILAPLGLDDTSVPIDAAMPEPYSHGYFRDDETGELRDVTLSNPALSWTAGAMISTLEDLRTWSEALAAGKLLSPEIEAERVALTPLPAPAAHIGYGLGIMDIAGFEGHNGGILGYSTFMVTRPEDGATIVTAVNLSGIEGGLADAMFVDIVDLLFPGDLPEATPSS